MNETTKSKSSVLIIDDESTNIMALTHILSPVYTVYAANNGENGVEAANKYMPDVILLDVVMPTMDGYDVITALKADEETQSIPVIFITSLSEDLEQVKGLALGAIDYITKPFSPDIVRLRVRNQIRIIEQIQTIQKTMASLEAASNAKSYFLGNMSHDFKTPLTIISLCIQNVTDMLNYKIKKDEIRTSLGRAQNEIMRMSRIVESAMGHFMMYESQNIEAPLDVAPVLLSGSELYHILLERNGNILTLDIPPTLPKIRANGDMLLLVLSNLLSNANRHTRNGEVIVRAKALEGKIAVSVQDSGSGVKEEILPKIFDRGTSDGSTGLGLSICKSTIEAHKGEIGVESKLGEGTTVWFTIPTM
jgi:signal transduction histidine kinase